MGRQNPLFSGKVYRLTLIENSTHKAIRSIRFTKPVCIIAIAAFVLAVVLLIYALVAFTPLRITIPGYPDAHSKKVAIDNAIKIDSLENAITRWTFYVENLREALTGQKASRLDSLIEQGASTHYLSQKSVKELESRDSLLRSTVIEEERFGISANAARKLPIDGLHFFSPVKGVITTNFDSTLHPAIDISTSKGAIVSSVLDGRLIQILRSDSTGYVLIVQHRDDIISIYSNIERVLAPAGEELKAGSPLGIVASGDNSSYQLHFELWHNGQALNPTKYIQL